MISMDTEQMRNLVAAASAANGAISEAVEALNRISTHDDWACKEKDAINQYTNTNKNRVRQLQENSSAFLAALTGAATGFEETEHSIADLFSSVESLLSNLLSISALGGRGPVQPGVISVPEQPSHLSAMVGELMLESVQAHTGGSDPLTSYLAGTMTEPISVCLFSDIQLN